MKTKLKNFLFFLILLFSLSTVVAKTKKADTEKETTKTSKYAKWYIYEKTGKTKKVVYKGPFGTVEDALTAWIDDKNLPAKDKYYIGKNSSLKTNNPAVYYHSKLKSMGMSDAQIIEEFPDLTEEEIATFSEEIVETDEDEEIFEVAIEDVENGEKNDNNTEIKIEEIDIFDTVEEEFVEIIDESEQEEEQQPDPLPQIDRYKKVYLSDFMDIPEYELPSDENYELGEDLIADLNEVDASGRTSLMNAIKAGNDWKIRALLNAGADINAKDKDGWTVLMYAVRYQSNLSILEILLEKEPDIRTINKYGHSALIIASCYNDNPDIIRKMLSYYQPSEKEVQKAFILLLSSQSISEYTLVAKMKVFLDMGLPINSYYNGKTPLMYACKYSSSTKAIKLLLDNNATVTVRSSDGKTAFQYASENKNLKHDDVYWSLNKR